MATDNSYYLIYLITRNGDKLYVSLSSLNKSFIYTDNSYNALILNYNNATLINDKFFQNNGCLEEAGVIETYNYYLKLVMKDL